MANGPVLQLEVDDRITLRKPHPCGGSGWTVLRVGADIGLACERCGRRVMLERRDLERRFNGFVGPRPDGAGRDAAVDDAEPGRRTAPASPTTAEP